MKERRGLGRKLRLRQSRAGVVGMAAAMLRRWLGAGSGTAAIEFAILAPMLAIMIVGLVDIGFAIRQKMEAQDAAAAGALYAVRNGWDISAITSAVTNAKPGSGLTATPAPVLFCGCPGSSGVAAATCGATCADGYSVRRYVTVSASMSRESFIASTLPLPVSITATAIARLP